MISQPLFVQVVPDLYSLYNIFLRFNCIPTENLTPGLRLTLCFSAVMTVIFIQ